MSIAICATAIPEVKILRPTKIQERRGFFSETYRQDALAGAGLPANFVQENHSLSIHPHTVRGLHYQTAPVAQDKLVRVVRGRILDVAVDLRRSSATYGKHVAVELSAENWEQLFIPIGFAHGFYTFEPNTEVVYKVTNYYSSAHDLGVAWNDPDLQIKWPVSEPEAILSDKDKKQPRLADIGPAFE